MRWLDRIARARTAGQFINEDYEAYNSITTCLIGEACADRGLSVHTVTIAIMDAPPNPLADRFHNIFGGASWLMRTNNFDAVEHLLLDAHDIIDQVKRDGLGS